MTFKESVTAKVRYLTTQPRDERYAWIWAAQEVAVVSLFSEPDEHEEREPTPENV